MPRRYQRIVLIDGVPRPFDGIGSTPSCATSA
jgi:hypothetical protein